MFYTLNPKGTLPSVMDTKIIEEPSFLYEVNQMMNFTITIPIKHFDTLTPYCEIELHWNDMFFHGHLLEKSANVVNMSVQCTFAHIVDELALRCTPVNYTVKDETLATVFADSNLTDTNITKTFANVDMTRTIDYTFSKQTKMEVLDEVCKLTDDVYWRINPNTGRSIELFEPVAEPVIMISLEKSSSQNIKIIEELEIVESYVDVVNLATAYASKSDNGNSTITLDPTKFDTSNIIQPDFPIVAINIGQANNDRIYKDYLSLRAGQNTNVEWAVVDRYGLRMMNDIIADGDFVFNDIYPTPENAEVGDETKEITEEDIKIAFEMLYLATIKQLKNSRMRVEFRFTVEFNPNLKAGDCIRLLYKKFVELPPDDCGAVEKVQIMDIDGLYYLQSFELLPLDKNGNQYMEVLLVDNLYNYNEVGA